MEIISITPHRNSSPPEQTTKRLRGKKTLYKQFTIHSFYTPALALLPRFSCWKCLVSFRTVATRACWYEHYMVSFFLHCQEEDLPLIQHPRQGLCLSRELYSMDTCSLYFLHIPIGFSLLLVPSLPCTHSYSVKYDIFKITRQTYWCCKT